jgi:hypothetical protein
MFPDDETHQSQASLVVSVWYEAAHPSPFRARLTSNPADGTGPVIRYAGSREAILGAVAEWLDSIPELNLPLK